MITFEHWLVDPVEFAREAVGFVPDAAQERVLRTEAKRVALCCSRQWGKSTVTAVLALHRALTREGALILALAPSERQSGLLVAKLNGFAKKLGIGTKRDGMNKCSAVFENGSAVVGLPGKEQYLRGYSAVRLLIVDEAARGTFGVPKRDLVSGLQVAFGERDLLLDQEVALVETLIRELMSMRSTVTARVRMVGQSVAAVWGGAVPIVVEGRLQTGRRMQSCPTRCKRAPHKRLWRRAEELRCGRD